MVFYTDFDGFSTIFYDFLRQNAIGIDKNVIFYVAGTVFYGSNTIFWDFHSVEPNLGN